jgi:hypothetical protein
VVRFISAEPLLGPLPSLDLTGMDWLIAGGESGGAHVRPMHPDWPRDLRDRCAKAGVPFFFKQWGQYGVLPARPGDLGVTVANDGTVYQPGELSYPDGPRYGEATRAGHAHAHLHMMYSVRKHRAGRLLDDELHNAFPEVVAHAG